MAIQIVVPIYNAYPVVKQCLEALIRHNSQEAVLLIDDASTDPRLEALYTTVPNHWQLIQNKRNLGFVKTANIGLASSTSHTILLNSDTIVASHWLAGFKQALENVVDLGTATPWSNNAEICSLPKNLYNNPVPTQVDLVGQALKDHHQPQWPDLPTAVGFCMLITAQAKQVVGYFDEQTFGVGYGEENDYSLRVAAHGLRNILVDNSYVAHVGNQSFKELQLKPNADTMARLLAKHPDYMQLIENFIEKNPLAALRQSIIAKIDAF